MGGDVIKSFLVGLGFDVDDSSLAKFNKSITEASVKIAALYGSIQTLSSGVFYSISKISEGFEQMGYEYRIIAPAINKALVLRRELLKAYSAAGINIVKTIQQSIKFNMSLAKTKFALEAIYKSVGAKFLPLLTKQMDIFRDKIYKNMPKIQAALEKFVTFLFKAFDATAILGARVWGVLGRILDFFVYLHNATDGWSTAILAAVAAWKFLNLSFLATPLGMLIAGLVAIAALFDDFKTWQEGGESLFNWESFIPTIDAVAKSLSIVHDIIDGIFTIIFNIGGLIIDVFQGKWIGAIDRVKDAFGGLVQVITGVWNQIKNLGNIGGAVGGWASHLMGGDNPNITPEQWAKFGRVGQAAPLGSNVSNQQQTNQNVSQQTSINVMGSADAQQTGKAIADQQSRVNFDMTRNLKGATR